MPFFSLYLFFFFLYIGCILNWNKFFQKIGIAFERIFLLGLMRPVGRDNIIKNIFLYILLRAFEEFYKLEYRIVHFFVYNDHNF